VDVVVGIEIGPGFPVDAVVVGLQDGEPWVGVSPAAAPEVLAALHPSIAATVAAHLHDRDGWRGRRSIHVEDRAGHWASVPLVPV
jgi:hypothetical protein